jgi:hypothetical protein
MDSTRHLSPDQFGDVQIGDNGWTGPLGSYGEPAGLGFASAGYQGRAEEDY